MPERWKQRRGFVATDVGDDDPLGARLPALAHHLGNDFWIGVGGLLRRAIPGDVGLDDHHILAADEAADAAQIFQALSEPARAALRLERRSDAANCGSAAMRWSRRACSACAGTGRKLCSLSQTAAPAAPAAAPPRRSNCSSASRRVMPCAPPVVSSGFRSVSPAMMVLPLKLPSDECAADRWCPACALRRRRWRCSAAGRPAASSVGMPASARLRSIICHAV